MGISWEKSIKAGQVISEPAAAMDLFPTIVNATGGDASEYELDGLDIMSMLNEGTKTPHDKIYWEMDNQTAVRCGNYKLVLNGQLEENEPAQDEVFLSNIVEDMSEIRNLAYELPEITRELKQAALDWRNKLENRWKIEFADNYKNLTGD